MHFEILVEGQTELSALSVLMVGIIGLYGEPHTWKIHKHSGIGQLPNDKKSYPNKKDRTLLHNYPSKLRAYGNDMGDDEAVIVLVDLDDKKDCVAFKGELASILNSCQNKPKLLIRIAIEELEAWYLGDEKAIKKAYPSYKKNIIDSYRQDSQNGTWEKLADAIHPGGMAHLMKEGKRSLKLLEHKRRWTINIVRHMDVEINNSPSFCCFRDGIRKLAGFNIN